MAWTHKFKAAVRRDHTTALQPGWQSKTLSLKKKNITKRIDNGKYIDEKTE